MVFQNLALYPHLNVYENIAFGLEAHKLPKAEVDERVRRVADMLGLSRLLERRPKALAGGQSQRAPLGGGASPRARAGGGVGPPPWGLREGRAADQHRRATSDRSSDPAETDPARARADHAVRHTRAVRGDDAGRPGRRDASRRAPAGGSPLRALRPTGEPVRRRVR